MPVAPSNRTLFIVLLLCARQISPELDFPYVFSPVVIWKAVIVFGGFFQRRRGEKHDSRPRLKSAKAVGVTCRDEQDLWLPVGSDEPLRFSVSARIDR